MPWWSSHRLVAWQAPLPARRLAAGAAALVGAAAALAVGMEASGGGLAPRPAVAIAVSYLFVGAPIVGFGVWAAVRFELPTFATLAPGRCAHRLVEPVAVGLAVGLLVSAASVALAGGDVDQPWRPWFWRRIQTPGGAALLAGHAAVVEETFFRLFLIPFVVSLVQRLRPRRLRLRVRDGRARVSAPAAARPRAAVAAAVVVSSLLFGLAHPFNALPAALLAPLLAYAYLRAGVEAAVLAHFLADMVVFVLYF